VVGGVALRGERALADEVIFVGALHVSQVARAVREGIAFAVHTGAHQDTLLLVVVVVWLRLLRALVWPPKRVFALAIADLFPARRVCDVHAHSFFKDRADSPPNKTLEHVDWVVRERFGKDHVGRVLLFQAHHPNPAADCFGVCVQL